jgi:hypothetical protein
MSFERSTLIVGHGGEEENTKGCFVHVEVEHMFFNGIKHLFMTQNLGTQPSAQ